MRKSAVVLPLAALVTGAAGFFLRRAELETAFEPSGFAVPGDSRTIALMALAAAVIILSAVAGFMISKRYQAAPKFERAYRTGGVTFFLGFLTGLAFIAGAALYLFEHFTYGSAGLFQYVFTALSALSGFSLILLAYAAFTGRFSGGLSYLSVFPTLFFCLWLIIIYRDNAANPVVLSYAYRIVAACSSAFLYYIAAGYAFGKPYPGKTAFGHLVTVYFCAVVQADPLPLWTRLFFGASLAFALFMGVRYFKNLSKKDA
ncbi:MAG TPA: hypothetical protein GXZ77_02465 [Papillibacter sp.]|jgi:hypothetical protein|nr:hypothetical protein [Papillibacter sp.]